ncbi:MAG: MFS transporter [Chloroflexota bacterium]|nr:MFS transporter [Chloroflexota bacterium]
MPRLRTLALNVEPLRAHRDFRLIFFGQVINNLGSQATQVALPYQLYLLTGSALALGALATIQLVAILGFSLAGGAIADAMDRRRLLLCTQTGLCSVSTALAVLALLQRTAPWHIFVLAFAQAVFFAVDRPARQAILPRLVSRDRLTAAIALNQAGVKAAQVTGPGLGGVLIASLGLGAAFGLDAVSFIAGLAALASIPALAPLGEAARPGWTTIREGLQYVVRAPAVLSAFAVDLDAMIFGLPVALFPILALQQFHAGPTGLGLLVSAPAAGAVLGVATSGWLRGVRFPGRVVIGMVALWGLAITLFGLTPYLPVALLFLAVGGAADAISAILRWTIIQLNAPDHLRGRVTSLNSMVVNAGPRLGDVEATSVAALTNAQVAVVSGGLLCLLGLVFVVRWFPVLASYDVTEYRVSGAESRVPGPDPGVAAAAAAAEAASAETLPAGPSPAV